MDEIKCQEKRDLRLSLEHHQNRNKELFMRENQQGNYKHKYHFFFFFREREKVIKEKNFCFLGRRRRKKSGVLDLLEGGLSCLLLLQIHKFLSFFLWLILFLVLYNGFLFAFPN